MGVGELDDEEYPVLTMGQAAELLGVTAAFLRSLDAAGALRPSRSAGGHRLYSRRQLTLAGRLRGLFDEGHTLSAAQRIVDLQDEVGRAQRRIVDLEGELDRRRQERWPGRGRAGRSADTPAARGHGGRPS